MTPLPQTRVICIDELGPLAAKTYPGIKVVASRAGNYQRAEGRRAMAEMLSAHGDMRGVLAANDYMAFGALEALAASADG